MALTIVFELVFFGVFLGVPIPELLAAYNSFAGELWIVVVVGVLLAPRLVQAASACFAGTAEVYRWPDARRRMPSASRSRAAGQVKAELVSVGQSGEQSLKRIETAGECASGGLKGLGRQAELLRTGIRTLGGALAGVTTVGGLAALVDRSLSAADAIGETASKIGVGVEALLELRFAAKASGIEQQTLDMALQRFVRRVAEAAQGTGEAKDALAQMGIALRDQSGNLRRSEELLGDVADAFTRIEDPAERVRLAFKLFDSEGVALVNLLRGGSDALEQMRERARSLGIVLDEHLVRDAGRARNELDTLAQVGEPHPGGARGGARDRRPLELARRCRRKGRFAWERLFDAEENSLRTLRYELDLTESTIAKLEGRIRELQESPTLGFTTFPRHGADQCAGEEARRAAVGPRSDPGPDRVPRRATGHWRAGYAFSARSR
jgi:hypothetical protein